MKGGHYTKESVVLEQQSTASDACRWESYRQYFPEGSVDYLESLFTTKGYRSVKEICRRYTRVLYDSSVVSMLRDKSPTREYWYCKYTHTTFFDAHAEGRRLQLGEGWHSNENPVRFWHSLLRMPKEAASDAMPNRQHTR